MKASQTSLLIPGGLLSATLLAVRLVCFPATAAQPTKTIAQAVKPFVDSNTLAGAVMLVESKDIINPVMLKPSSPLAFWALVIDAGLIAALLLTPDGGARVNQERKSAWKQ